MSTRPFFFFFQETGSALTFRKYGDSKEKKKRVIVKRPAFSSRFLRRFPSPRLRSLAFHGHAQPLESSPAFVFESAARARFQFSRPILDHDSTRQEALPFTDRTLCRFAG